MRTLPTSVEEVIEDYVWQLNKTNPGNVAGVCLTGSVALGDYYTNKSDIDFITIMHAEPTKDLLLRLKRIHRSIERRHHHPKLNGYYVTMAGISNNNRTFPSFFRNKLYAQRAFDLRNFSLFELKFFSLGICGLPVDELPISVEFEAVAKELHDNINSYWATWVHNHSEISLGRMLLILFPRLMEWGVLGVARQLYTLTTGSVVSKLEAGSYYLPLLPDEFQSVMATVISTRRLNGTELKPSIARANAALRCMQWFIREFNEVYASR